ncbi:MAG TPA: PIN domain-containing protein [Pseudomonas sp.]|uniref:PIN domain-containing protein n=1 Tax=Pseudomonas sp. TaxID=306 RepID=UPI002C597F57|nr:PIN domain-containing protein [Pseudomonas sp.]HTO20535.1 PIN domain-containing protein [Pseudomonas sp.]
MHLVMLDTCVWLDISSKKSELPILLALEHLVGNGSIKILLPDLIRAEYERNKDRVVEATRKRLSSEFRVVKNAIESFGGPGKEKALAALDDVNHRLPILSEATESIVHRVTDLFASSLIVAVSDEAKIKAAERALSKKAPFQNQKNSIADAVIIESFQEYRLANLGRYETFRFVTHNVNDFSAKDHRLPHSDFADIFEGNTRFYNSTSQAIAEFLDLDEFHYEHDMSWIDQTRGLQEILNSMDELVDKIWYNRHMYRAYQIEQGIIKLIPEGAKRDPNEIHQHIWNGALAAAEKVRTKYKEVGPWDDFEWGMLNGKLSALRWVLGDEWDMLDT